MPPGGAAQQSDYARSVFKNNLGGHDAYSRHVRYITQFQNVYGGGGGSGKVAVKGKTELDGLVEKHRFLRDDDDKELEELSPEDRIAVKYYRGLFKEFALVDLKHYKSGQFALRWRTEPEVLSGLGQFTCGNTRCAYHQAEDDMPVPQPKLVTLELPFGYVEEGEAKQALVKVVLCERCKKKLMWKRNKDREEAGEGEAEPESPHEAGGTSFNKVEGTSSNKGERTSSHKDEQASSGRRERDYPSRSERDRHEGESSSRHDHDRDGRDRHRRDRDGRDQDRERRDRDRDRRDRERKHEKSRRSSRSRSPRRTR